LSYSKHQRMIRNVIRQNSLTTKWLLFFVTEKYDDVGLMVRNEKLLFFCPHSTNLPGLV